MRPTGMHPRVPVFVMVCAISSLLSSCATFSSLSESEMDHYESVFAPEIDSIRGAGTDYRRYAVDGRARGQWCVSAEALLRSPRVLRVSFVAGNYDETWDECGTTYSDRVEIVKYPPDGWHAPLTNIVHAILSPPAKYGSSGTWKELYLRHDGKMQRVLDYRRNVGRTRNGLRVIFWDPEMGL